jgi:hypothetical protein
MTPRKDVLDDGRRDGEGDVLVVLEGVVEKLYGCTKEGEKFEHETGIVK